MLLDVIRHLASIRNISRVHDGDLNPSLAPLLPQPTNGGGEFENEEERTLVSVCSAESMFHNLAKISRPNKNKKRKEGMEVEDGRPWGITISVVEDITSSSFDCRIGFLMEISSIRELADMSQVHDALADELAMLKQVNEFAANGLSPPRKNGFARRTRKSHSNRGRWNQLRSLGEAKNLLQYMFNSAAHARCQLWEKDMEIREVKDQIKELVGLLRQSYPENDIRAEFFYDYRRKELGFATYQVICFRISPIHVA
ncbi:Kinesin-like protein [Vigna angularis]|uniref:Kinesin-like protein n=1 Tax=Phaseolus angularis TaxID=3914 RepID=A0A8T0JGY4_PHAAN|nr:Kinesin-like protein [Vigna angularis]